MLSKKHKLFEIKTSKLIDSLFVGNYKTNYKGKGIEFVNFKEYDYGDDAKNIDFLKSEEQGKTLVKMYEEERELSIYFILDPYLKFENTKLNLIYELLYLIGLSTIKGGNKVGFSNNKKLLIAKKGKQNFINIINYIENNSIESNKLDYFNNLKINKSLVFYITDKLEVDNKQLKVLGLKNDLILCNIFDSFENTLEGRGIKGFGGFFNNLFINLSDKEKKQEYIKLREVQIQLFKKQIIINGGKYLFLDETLDIYKEVIKIFK